MVSYNRCTDQAPESEMPVPMRILCISFWFYDYTIQFANALSRRCTVMLLLPDIISQDYLDLIDEGVEVYLFHYNNASLGGYVSVLSAIREIIHQKKEFHPDIIHFQVQNPVLCMILPFIRDCPHIATIHDITPHVGEDRIFHPGAVPYKILLHYSRTRTDHILVHGMNLKKDIEQNFSVPREKVHVMPMGECEVEPFQKYADEGVHEEKDTILFFGRIFAYKGLDYLIQAEPLISQEVPGATIVIAGKGEDFSRYEDLMENREKFSVHNYYIPYDEGAQLFQQSSVVVLPYIEASQSGVVTTAYGFGKPVVVTDVGSIPEIVDDGTTGFVVPPRDPAALAEAIVTLLKDDVMRRRMGDAALNKLKTDLSWETIIDRAVLPVYRQALTER